MKRTRTETNAQMIWDRSGEQLPKAGDDERMLALVKRAQGGDEAATAGLILVMEGRVRSTGRFYGQAADGRVFEAEIAEGLRHGQGAALSNLWIAIGNYDTERNQTNVVSRLWADVRYLCRAPTKLANVVDVRLYEHDVLGRIIEERTTGEENYAEIETAALLEQALEDNEISEVRRELARSLMGQPKTDREIAAELGIPFGSMSRHTRGLRRELSDLRDVLVA